MESPRKTFWRSASWSTRSHSSPKLRPGFILPPLKVSRYAEVWPGSAAADASSLVDGDLSRVTEYLYLGGAAAACDRDLLRRRGITHVLNCAGFSCREQFAGEFTYMTLWLRDQPSEDISSLLYDVFDFIEKAFNGRGRVLVHCSRGTSRSAALVVGYLMWRQNLSFDDALSLVRVARPEADPNPGFAAQLLQWRNLTPSSFSSSPRVYRMAPHSAYDPLHLVPKMVEKAGPSELDSRGAFLVESDSGAVYLWVGADSESAMAESAAMAGDQLLRYERAPGPVVTVSEGSEQDDFWDALGCCSLPSDDRTRRRESYDLDFEMHKRALKNSSSLASATETNGVAVVSPGIFSCGSATPASSSSDTSTLYTSSATSTSAWHSSSPGSDLSAMDAQSLSPLLWPPLRLPSADDEALYNKHGDTLYNKDD